ncbi:hypothetical protein BH11PLA2_BH11PLA2_44080 [soil metagenome]
MTRVLLAGAFALGITATTYAESPLKFTRTTIDSKFQSEGCAVADVNKDGHMDVINGEFWYEGPDFKSKHEMQKPGEYGDGEKGYSHSFCVWMDDINGDGFPDCIVIDFPGTPCYWLENPKGKDDHWKKHPIWHSACNETPLYKDLFGTGKRVLIMGFQPKGVKEADNLGRMAYFTPNTKDLNAEWEMHPLSDEAKPGQPIPGTMKFSHGLGVSDMNGDGRLDVLASGTNTKGAGGWWEQPEKADGVTPWKFHPFKFGDACADMYAADLSGTGKMDLLCTSAHYTGFWQLKNRGTNLEPVYDKVDLFPGLITETHAAHFVDLDGDGLRDLVTGKRFYSHGKREKGWDMPAVVTWFKASKTADGAITFTPHVLDDNSGIGTQFEIADVNKDGKLDIITSNKKGTHVLIQK